MSSLYKRYKTDKGLEDGGAWVDFGDGIGVRIRRYKSKLVQEEKRRVERPHRATLDRGDSLPEDIAKDLMVEQMVNAIVVDWKGVTDEEGDEVPYSKENVRRVLNDLPDFLIEIFSESVDRERFKAQSVEDAGKN